MSEYEHSFGQPEEPQELPIDSFGLRELLKMTQDPEAIDIGEVIAVIDDVLLEPLPDLSDPAAVEEFNAKMSAIRDWARTQEDRTDKLLLEQRAEERLLDTN